MAQETLSYMSLALSATSLLASFDQGTVRRHQCQGGTARVGQPAAALASLGKQTVMAPYEDKGL